MKVQDVGPAIVKRAWIVLALVLLSTLVAAIVAQVQSPVYKVEIALSATAPINPTTKLPDGTIMLGLAAQNPSIANYTESLSVAEAVSARLANQGIEVSPEELLKKVSSVPEANSTSVKMTLSDRSPTRVADIANAYGEVLVLKTNQTTEFFDQEFKNLLLNGSMVFTNRAAVPEKPTQPKTFAYIGLGFFVGLLFGLLLVLLIEYFNPHFRNPREVEETLELPVMGTLPKERGARSTALLSSPGEGSRTWEAYGKLRSSLLIPPETAPASILLASATPFVAAPGVAANMAASVARTGRRVLLVDCDLGERALSRLMECEDRSGLSDALEKGEDVRGRIIETKVPGLYLLPAGTRRENSTDLLSTPSFAEELREQEGLYDKVLLYAPSLADSIDAAVVAAQAEASLIVIDADRCTRKAAQEAMFNLQRLGITPTGVALANVKMKVGRSPHKRREAGPGREMTAPVSKKAPPQAAAQTAVQASPPPASSKDKAGKRRRSAAAPPQMSAAQPVPPTAAAVRPEPDAAATAGSAGPEPGGETAAAPEEASAQDRAAAAAGTPSGAGPAVSEAEAHPGRRALSWGHATAPAAAGETRDGLQQIKESVAEDFRRMGETGAPIPKNWLRALNSDKADVRDSASAAITVYYQTFLQRYRISDENVERITRSIIRMMRREGEYANMSEEEAQRHLRQMLVDAGARFSGTASSGEAPAAEPPGPDRGAAGGPEKDEGLKQQEKRRFRIDARGGRKAAGRGKGPAAKSGNEEGIDWE